MLKTVELFAGKQSFSKVAKIYGCQTFTVDWESIPGIDLVADIGLISLHDSLPYTPDVVWASPDCKTYSKAARRLHRVRGIPVSDYAVKCDDVNIHFLSELELLLQDNPRLIYFIENPQGLYRYMFFIQDFIYRTNGRLETVCYCKYGYENMKPTDIFTNSPTWIPRPMCFAKNENCKHVKGRNSRLSGLSKKNRSNIPKNLMFEIIESLL